MITKLPVLVATLSALVAAGCPKGPTGTDTAADLGTTPADPDTAPADPDTTPAAESHRFPVQADLIHLCGQSVLGQDGTEILWDLFWSTREPAEVARFYSETLGTAGLAEADGEWTWRVPADGIPDRVLNVMPADRPHPECGTRPADAKTVAVFSEMLRRTPPAAPEPPTPTLTP